MSVSCERHSKSMEEADEPSIFSSDANERKLARRLRIQRGIEARTKKAKTEDEEVVEMPPIEKQILDSTEVLAKLSAEGDEVVTGVRIANDARELERRKEMKVTRDRLLTVLEEEDKKCMEKYHEITKKWPDILASKDPLHIHDELEAQNTESLKILEKKDALIAELKQELENADIKYAEDVKKQNEDIDLLIERMENQVRTMSKAHHHELALIENVIESERKTFLTSSMERWEVLFKKLRDDTLEGREQRKEIMRTYEEEMKKAIIEHQEEFRKQKISFELEIQNLQQEMQNMKAVCMMNIEKLDYNYAVLKRREEENIIVKNQQKRRINKLQDAINSLKKTYTELEESTRLEIQKLMNQILKSDKAILALQEKSNHIATINDRKYIQIWDMNIKTANELIDKILTADKIIHTELLGLEWQPPEQRLLKKEDLASYCGAMCALKHEREEARKRKMISTSYKPATTLEDVNLERQLLNHIAKLISKHCDYLIEDTLKELLSNYTEDDKLLIRLDKVFEALKITSVQEFHFLLNFFLPYAYCPTCTINVRSTPSVCGLSRETSSSVTSEPEVCGGELNTDEIKLVAAMQVALCFQELPDDDEAAAEASTPEVSSIEPEAEDEQIKSTCVSGGIIEVTDENGEPKRQLVCDKGHLLEIEVEFVSNALKEFLERYEFVKMEKTPVPLAKRVLKEKMTVSRNITEEDIIKFWQQYRNIFPEDRERLWDNLSVGLKKYHEVLKERHKLNEETESLRKQNAELQRLLKNHSEHEFQDEELTEEETKLLQHILQN